MSQLSGFLRSIVADPSDLSSRLIFADWLEEQADPALAVRGELMRLQCELAAWVPDLERRTALQQRERQLLQTHQAGWVGELQRRCEEIRYERGLAQITFCTKRFAPRIFSGVTRQQFDQAWVETVRLEQPLHYAETLWKAPQLGEVASLDLSGGRLNDHHFLDFLCGPLDRLIRLNVANNFLTDDSLRTLAGSPLAKQLLWLDLRNNHLTPGALMIFLASPLAERLRWLEWDAYFFQPSTSKELDEWRQKKRPTATGQLRRRFTNSIGMELVLIPAGTFLMGSPEDEGERRADEGPVHAVTISRPFYIGVYPVTQGQFEQLMGRNPAHFNGNNFGGPGHPVENIHWDDAQAFCQQLSSLPTEKALGRPYRLPAEAEWEYACRAGTTTPFHFGSALNLTSCNYDGRINYLGASVGLFVGKTTPVGSYPPNAFGLYDMHGNVWEWCQDWYGGNYYQVSPAIDPPGPDSGNRRVVRGGSWDSVGSYCRSAHRHSDLASRRDNFTGFRVVLCVD